MGAERGGWFGRYLRVDVSIASAAAASDPAAPVAVRADAIALSPGDAELVIGGVGLGALTLLRETPPRFDPLGPEAAIVFAFGPLVGTPLTTSAKFAVVAKSPLTERINDALSSSDFAICGKRTGFDALVVVGRAERPSILLIDEGAAALADASDLWGRDLPVSEVTAALSARHPGFEFVVIGTAGERLVRYAGLVNSGRHAGRGGLGAVLGAKRIKAIGVRGRARAPVADLARTVELSRDLARRSMGPATEKYRELGTVANLAAFNRLSALPTRNFQQATFEGAAALSGETLKLTRERGRGSCASCTIGCEHFFEVTPGAAPVKAEYENVFALGPLCGVSDPEVVLRASRACDELGIDTISAGGTIAFAMECAERGLLDHGPWSEDARGLRFGDGARLLALLDDIGRRRGALGDLLADGSRRAAERIGGGSSDFAPHVKGLEIPGYEPRTLHSMALGFAVGSRGADHNRSGAYEADLSGKVDRFAGSDESARLAAASEDRAAIIDSLILCKFLRNALGDFYAEAAEMLRAVTGVDWDADAVRRAAGRIVLLRKLFNVREGWTPAEDTLPVRLLTERLAHGSAGAGIDQARLQAMKSAYYAARGWAADGQVPQSVMTDAGLGHLPIAAAAPKNPARKNP
jgi:aldehyde:ferredoxin oxidoreductase